MQGITEFIVEIKEPVKESIKIGGTEIFVDGSYDQTKYSNRIGKVISTPIGYETPIKVGDEVLIVHTVLMSQTYQGKQHDPVFLVDKSKGYYRLTNELIVMYRPCINSEWKCNWIHVMVSPIAAEKEDFKIGSFYLGMDSYDTDVECNTMGFLKQEGHIKYLNKELKDAGVKVGDKVHFEEHGDYEFNLDGEVVYCMDNRDILTLLD